MKKNYEEVPDWWFYVVLILTLVLSLFACEGFGKQLQLPWWGLLLACGIALLFTLPVGIIQATTNRQPGLNVITELIIGYLYPGKPLANVCFKTYGYISMVQALSLTQDLKLGHYMKVPPKSMFIVQMVQGTCYQLKLCTTFAGELLGIFFNWYVYKRHKRWYARHTYVLSAALDAGVAFMGVLIFFVLQSFDNSYGPDWWGLEANDHCPLASCPTAPGIVVKGCPVL
ncbi:hypothetical protein REPUB_Repub05bG0008100 [Reevesia pubescens]